MADTHAPASRLPRVVAGDIQACLDAFAGEVSGMRNAVVASVDGFAIAQVSDRADRDDRLAAMTSSMLALATAVGRELRIGELEVLMMEAADGKVLMLAIPAPGRALLLMAACTQRSVIGHVLWHARQCSAAIAGVLGGH